MNRAAWLLPLVLLTSGCATGMLARPSGNGAAAPEAPAIWADTTARCASARVFVAQVRMNGWVGDRGTRLGPPTMNLAVTRDEDIYLEVPMIVGGPVVQMAGRAGDVTLVLPRDGRVHQGTTYEVIHAMTGLRWGPRRLLEVLSACVAAPAGEVAGRRFDRLLRVDVSASATAWLERRGSQWRVRAADLDGWRVDYEEYDVIWPRRIRVVGPPVAPLDLLFTVEQTQVNVSLPATAFDLRVPADAVPMTVDELRANGPLRDRGGV